jgi:glycosyltransferase involved in cell wall biosynthesis
MTGRGPERRAKVLVLIKGLGLGGAERLLVDSLPFLNRSQFEYHVAYLVAAKNFLVPELESAGIPVHCLGACRAQRALSRVNGQLAALTLVPRALRRLLALQRRESFALIQADLPVAGILARVMGRWTSVPVIYTEHNLQERYHPVTRWANAATYRWNRQVLAVSSEVAASIGRHGLRRRTRVVTLANGVPVEQIRAEAADACGVRNELGIPTTNLVVGTVAVFRSQKRLSDWVDVAAHVAARRPDVTFLLVGGGPLESEIRNRVRARGLSNRVLMPGFRPDGRRLVAAMDVFLMTSEFEGLPIAMLEAMTLGKPVVATRAGGIPEVLADGNGGLLASVGAIDDLSSCVLQLLEDAERRARMGAAAAVRVESRYHLKRRVKAIESLYAQLLDEAA